MWGWDVGRERDKVYPPMPNRGLFSASSVFVAVLSWHGFEGQKAEEA